MAEDVQSNININIDTTSAMASIKLLQQQISTFHSTMAKMGAANAATSANMQQNLINSINASGKFAASITKIKTTTESFTDSLEKNKLGLGQYFKYSIASTKSFGKMFENEFNTINKVARERVKDLQTQYIKLGRDGNGAMQAIKVRPLVLDMENLGTKTQIAAQRQALLNQLLKQGSTNLLNFGKNTQWAGRQLMVGFTIPLVMMGSAAVKSYQQMEDAAIKFKRVYGDTSTTIKETDTMLKQVQQLANAYTQYGVAVSDTMALAGESAAMGKTGADLLQQVNNATKLSVLGGVDQQQALETTVSLTNAFGIATKDLSSNVDFLNSVENQTILNIADMTVAIPKAAPVVKQLGGSVKDLAFFLTAMKEGGINASEGANALKSGLASMINPSSAATKMLSSLGINIKQIVTNDKGNLKKTVVDFATALDKLDPLQRAKAIEQMFGKFQFARISTLFKNVVDNGSQAGKVLELSGKTAGELAYISQQEMKKLSDSPLYKFQKTMADLQAGLAPIGEQFLKVITPILKVAGDLAKGFADMPEGLKSGIVTIVSLVGGLGPLLLMTFGLIANGAANIIKGFSLVKNIFNRTGKSALDLGSQVDYMTQQQLEASAVASSLDQVHGKLRQTFTSEAVAVNELTLAYERSIAVQHSMGGFSGAPRAMPRKYAAGGVISGPGTGTSDSILARVSNGEAIIPAKHAARYPGLVNQLVSGNIPGFANGRSANGFSMDRYTSVFPQIEDILKKNQSTLGGVLTQILKIADTTTEIAGTGIGASSITGVNAAHGNKRKILTVEEARAIGESIPGDSRFKRKMKNAQQYKTEDISAYSNLTFPLPRAANLGAISGEHLASWVKEDPKRFMSMITAQGKVDANDPGIKEFAENIAKKMAQAGSKAITEGDFEKIVEDSIRTQSEGAAKQALISARDTYQTVNVTNDPLKRAKREPAPTGISFGPDLSLQENTGQKAYTRIRGALARGEQWKTYSSEANAFVKSTVEKMLKDAVSSVKDGAKKVLRIASPSKETEQIGENAGQGLINGIKKEIPKAIVAGEQLGIKVVEGARRAQGGGQITVPGGTQSGGNRNFGRRSIRPADITPIQMAAIEAERLRLEEENSLKYVPSSSASKEKGLSRSTSRVTGVSNYLKNVSPGKVMGAGFGLSSAVGLASMIPGQTGQIAQSVAGPIMAISTLTSMFPGIVSGFGALLPALVPLAPAILGVGAIFGALTVAAKIYEDAQKREYKAIHGLGDAATLTTKKIKTLSNFFGVADSKSPLEQATIAPELAKTATQLKNVTSLLENKDFQSSYKEDIKTLSSASAKQVTNTLTALTVQLRGKGYTDEQIQILATALKQASGKVSSGFDATKITNADIASNISGQIKSTGTKLQQRSAEAPKLIDLIKQLPKSGLTKEEYSKTSSSRQASYEAYQNFGNDMQRQATIARLQKDSNGKNSIIQNYTTSQKESLSTTAANLGTMFKGFSSQFTNGTLEAKDFNAQFANLKKSLTSIKNNDAIKILEESIKDLPKPIKDSVGKLSNINDQLLIVKANSLGISVALEEISAIATGESGNADAPERLGGKNAKARITAAIKARLKLISEALKSETPKDPGNGSVDNVQAKIDNLATAINAFGSVEDKINKKYDARIKALEEIKKLNDSINNQKKTQLDLAEALANGDIAAAARIAEEARAQNAQDNLAAQNAAAEQARQNELQNATVRVGGKNYTRAQLEAMQQKLTDAQTVKALKKIHLSTGGMVPGYAVGGMVKYFANGGFSSGTDTTPAMLTPGEFVIKKAAVDRIGTSKLNSINNGTNSDSSVYNYSINVNVATGSDANDIANTVMRQIRNIDNQRIRGVAQ